MCMQYINIKYFILYKQLQFLCSIDITEVLNLWYEMSDIAVM